MDLASEMPPTVKIHGIDIEGGRFPKDCPDNVSFSICSILSLPQDWTGRFDYIHQRLLGGALTREEWLVAITEMWRVVKPGGWVQLGEYGLWEGNLGPATDVQIGMQSQLYKRKGLVYRSFADIPDLLREVGFRHVHAERGGYPIGGEKGKIGRFCALEYYRAVAPQVVKFGVASSREEVDKSIDAMEREWEQVDDAEAEVIYTWARKPMDA